MLASKLARLGRSSVMSNVVARIGALVSLALGTLLVARLGGTEAVGIYALLRVLPGLVGVVIACGLPGAIAYFVAGPSREDSHLPITVICIALAGGVAGTVLWAAASPLVGPHLFPGLSLWLVLLGGLTVLTQLFAATAKSCSQGSDDMRGANLVIFNEEFMFLPAYAALWAANVPGFESIILGLLIADVVTFLLGWHRLARRGFFRNATRPSVELGRRIASYGIRQQVGGLVSLMNLRFDFIVLSLLSGPAVLGVYAIASKFAELLKIPALALWYVLYPQFARAGRAQATTRARALIPRAALLTLGLAVPLWLAASLVIPAMYGTDFEPAIVPAQILLLGLAVEGAAGVITGFLYGVGRPGLNSWAMTAGFVVTIALDFILIPRYGATGAACASAIAYLTTTATLGWFFWRLGRKDVTQVSEESLPQPLASGS